MRVKTEPSQIWQEYSQGESYNESLNLYDNVQKCEDMYSGNQWKGLERVELDKPVFNILDRVVSFFIASLVSDEIAIHMERYGDSSKDKAILDMIDGQFDQVMQNTRLKSQLRELVRSTAVDGDGCIHYVFDTEDHHGLLSEQDTPGQIHAERLENYDVFFGNTERAEVELQPWIIIRMKYTLEEAKDLAEENGADPDAVQEDSRERGINNDQEKGKVTVLRKYWKDKKTGSVWFTDVTHNMVLIEPTDTGYTRYPLVWLNWKPEKNRYHGVSAVLPAIPNQIAINKLIAMAIRHESTMAFPTIVYNRAMLPGGWPNRVGQAVGVNGTPDQAIATSFRAQDMSAQLIQLINLLIAQTKELMGASDASLGTITPNNTSAIIATQKATAVPLELQKMAFYACLEESARIWMDMMGAKYGQRTVMMDVQPMGMQQLPDGSTAMAAVVSEETEGQTVKMPVPFNFDDLNDMDCKVKVDVGASTMWSELQQIQILDSLFVNGILTDPVDYLKAVPSGVISNKQELIKSAEAKQQQLAEQQAGGSSELAGAVEQQMGGLPQMLQQG